MSAPEDKACPSCADLSVAINRDLAARLADPIATILATPCPRHADNDPYSCPGIAGGHCTLGDDERFCAARIRAALVPK